MLKSRDSLLAAAKVIVWLIIAFVIFAAAMLAIGFVALLTVGRAELLAELAAANAPSASYWLILAMIGGLIGLLWLTFQFMRKLSAIIQSVNDGDPFRSSNATLLAEMGWISVGAHITAIIVAIPAAWLVPVAEAAGRDVDFDLSLGLGTILMTLIIFILARVFKHGVEMREDLEGTV